MAAPFYLKCSYCGSTKLGQGKASVYCPSIKASIKCGAVFTKSYPKDDDDRVHGVSVNYCCENCGKVRQWVMEEDDDGISLFWV